MHTTAIKKLKNVERGTCDVCKKAVPLEFHDVDVRLTLCNECAGHFAVAEYWLHRFGYFPCTPLYNERDL